LFLNPIKLFFVVSNSSIQSVRVSVRSSSYQNEMMKKTEEPTATSSSFVQEDKQNFDRRPLLDLLNQLNQHKELNQSDNIDKSRKTLSPSPSKILPPKQISPFRPVILHKKSQVRFNEFDFHFLD